MIPPGRPRGECRNAQHEAPPMTALEPLRASVAYWTWLSRMHEIWWTRSARPGGDRRGRARALRRAGGLRAHALAALSRSLPRAAGAPARPFRRAGGHQERADGALRRVGDRLRGDAGGRGGLSRRPQPHRPELPRPLRGVEELGQHRRAGHLRAGRRRAGDVRRADGRGCRPLAPGSAARGAAARARRARRAGGRDRRAFREHRVVGAPVPEQSLDRGPRLLDPGSAADASSPN